MPSRLGAVHFFLSAPLKAIIHLKYLIYVVSIIFFSFSFQSEKVSKWCANVRDRTLLKIKRKMKNPAKTKEQNEFTPKIESEQCMLPLPEFVHRFIYVVVNRFVM